MVAQPLVSDPPTWTEIPEVLTQFEATTSSITGIEKKMEKVGHVFFFQLCAFSVWVAKCFSFKFLLWDVMFS